MSVAAENLKSPAQLVSGSGLVVSQSDFYNGKEVLIRENQAKVRARSHQRNEYRSTGTSDVITFGGTPGFVDFKIPSNQIEEAEHVILQCDAVVSTAAVTYLPFPRCIDRIEIFGNGNMTAPLQTIAGDALWLNYLSMNTEQLTVVTSAGQLNMTTGMVSEGSIAVGTRYHVMNLLGPFLTNMRLRALPGETYVRIWFLASGVVTTGTVGNLKFQNFCLVIESEKVLEQEKKAFDRFFDKLPLSIQYEDVVKYSATQTLTQGTELAIQLTAFKGAFSHFFIFITKGSNNNVDTLVALAPNAAPPGAGSQTDGQYAYISFLDASGKHILSPGPFRVQDMRYQWLAKRYPSAVPASLPIYCLPFADNPSKAILKGEVDGVGLFSGDEQLVFRPASSNFVTASDYVITILGYKVQHLLINKGKSIEVARGAINV